MPSTHNFLFGVILMYGFLFVMFTLSDGAIVGLPEANVIFETPEQPEYEDNFWGAFSYGVDSIIYGIALAVSFFFVLFINPFSDIWWMVPFNWAILGTVVYIYTKLIRGGG